MGHLIMSEKERLRKAVMEMVRQGKLTLKQAATQCELSYRQAKRVYRSYKEKGDAGLVHLARGRKSNRRHPHQEIIIARYKERYEGFGPTLAAEYLEEEDKLRVDHETLRRLLLSRGLWSKQRKRSPYRRQRECRAQFGELVQIDGSIHDWLSEECNTCLINMVDDATSKTHAYLDSGETTRAVFITMWQWIERYGIPLEFYVDLKSVYISRKDKSFSQVEKACKKLGIHIIEAHSPQAKGRVERKHGVYQDRFVKELKLKNVKTIREANEILANGFLDKLNKKFEKVPRNNQSAHIPMGDVDLNQILCWEYKRTVLNDWTFSFKNSLYQVEKESYPLVKPRKRIVIRKHLDNSMTAWCEGKQIVIKKITRRPQKVFHYKDSSLVFFDKSAAARKASRNSPWRKFNSHWFKKTGT